MIGSCLWLLVCFSVFKSFNYGLCDIFVNNRLPNNTKPFHYDLDISITLASEFKFAGNVRIYLFILEPTEVIVLHKDGIDLYANTNYIYDNLLKVKYDVKSSEYNKKNNLLQLRFQHELDVGNYTLNLDFYGHFAEDDNGLFALHYNTTEGVKRWSAMTNFQPIGARKMFPCFDEPNRKATFSVQVTHNASLHATSNAELQRTEKISDQLTKTSFKITPIMSTYLLAIVVSDFQFIETYHNRRHYTLHSEPAKLCNLNYSLNISMRTVDELEELFNIKYGLSKLDQFTFEEFNGGMENWGLVLYSDSVVLEPNAPMNLSKMEALDLVTHEVAHQWFGNLVTCDWWAYTWLNEGFATFFSKLIGDFIDSTARLTDFYTIMEVQTLLRKDSVVGAPITLNDYVDDNKGVDFKLTRYTYRKGSAVLRLMYESFPDFIDAVGSYLKKWSYRTVTPQKLFDEFHPVLDGVPVAQIMDSWINQPGYPLLTVHINYRRNTITVSQKRFVRHPCHPKDSYKEIKWWIPLSATSELNPVFTNLSATHWMRPTDKSVTYSIDLPSDKWIIFNLQQIVPCRVNYNIENWLNIIRYLNSSQYQNIHAINRAQLLDDSFHLALANELPFEVFFQLLDVVVRTNKDDFISEVMNRNLSALKSILSRSDIFDKFKNFIKDFIERSNKAKSNFRRRNTNNNINHLLDLHAEFEELLSDNISWDDWAVSIEDSIFFEADYEEIKLFLASNIKTVPENMEINLKNALAIVEDNIHLKNVVFNHKMDELRNILKNY